MQTRDINAQVVDWVAPPVPGEQELEGQYALLEPLSADRHAVQIHAANIASDAIWDYLPYGPFETEAAYLQWVRSVQDGRDPKLFAIRDKQSGSWCGVASFLRIAPDAGSIEVGHINFAPALQKTRAATESMYLMMKWAFEAGYRRYEWKCNAANLGSRRAAQRLGLSYEGIFRQAAVIKGCNRDTAWFAAIDSEWPALTAAFETWLDAANFGPDGHQKISLSDLTRPVLVNHDPGIQP